MKRLILFAAVVVVSVSQAVSLAAADAAADSSSRTGSVLFSKNVFLHQLQARDSVLIGDQLVYGVTMDKVEDGTSFLFPEYGDTLCSGVMLLRPWTVDTLKVYKGKKDVPRKYDLAAGVVITSFDEGRYRLPNLVLLRNSPNGVTDTLVYEGPVLDVMTMPVDTSSFVVHDIKGQVRYPLTAAEVLPWVALFYGVVLLVIAAVCLFRIYRRRKAGELAHKDPAHIVALRKLDKYRGDKLWAPEKQKQFYSGITDVLREYIAARYGIGAMEMTTAEIFTALGPLFKDEPQARRELLGRLQDLFETSDFVKFAKHVSEESEASAALPLAVKFVTDTYQTELADETRGAAEASSETGSKPKEE